MPKECIPAWCQFSKRCSLLAALFDITICRCHFSTVNFADCIIINDSCANKSHSESALFSDLEDLFQHVGVASDSLGLTYSDLKKVFGLLTPKASTLECYDIDGDQRYSLRELRAAVHLWANHCWQQWTVLIPSRAWGSEFPTLLCNCCTFVNWIFIILIVGKVALACPLITHLPSLVCFNTTSATKHKLKFLK